MIREIPRRPGRHLIRCALTLGGMPCEWAYPATDEAAALLREFHAIPMSGSVRAGLLYRMLELGLAPESRPFVSEPELLEFLSALLEVREHMESLSPGEEEE